MLHCTEVGEKVLLTEPRAVSQQAVGLLKPCFASLLEGEPLLCLPSRHGPAVCTDREGHDKGWRRFPGQAAAGQHAERFQSDCTAGEVA